MRTQSHLTSGSKPVPSESLGMWAHLGMPPNSAAEHRSFIIQEMQESL